MALESNKHNNKEMKAFSVQDWLVSANLVFTGAHPTTPTSSALITLNRYVS